jgi:hypothetical protein
MDRCCSEAEEWTLASGSSEAVQHLARDPVLLYDSLPIAKSAQFPLDHEGPDPFGGFVQQGRSIRLPLRSVRSGLKRAQARQGMLDLGAQGASV